MLEFDLSVPELLLADEYYKKVRSKDRKLLGQHFKVVEPFPCGSGYSKDIKEKREFIWTTY